MGFLMTSIFIFKTIFYAISAYLSYQDIKTKNISNLLQSILYIFVLVSNIYLDVFSIYSLLLSIFVFVFFVFLSVINPKLDFGGADMKFYAIVILYLPLLYVPYFILITGIVQLVSIIIYQKIKNEKEAPQIPFILLSVIITETIMNSGLII